MNTLYEWIYGGYGRDVRADGGRKKSVCEEKELAIWGLFSEMREAGEDGY